VLQGIVKFIWSSTGALPKARGYRNKKIMKMKLTRRAWIRTVIYSGFATVCGVGYISAKRLEVVRLDVPLAGLPKKLDGLKIGVMADFHAGPFTRLEDIVYSINLISKEKPDLIVLLGDYVEGGVYRRPNPKKVEKEAYVFDALKDLKAPLGIYAVLGNHDHWTDADLVREKLSNLAIPLLDNQNTVLDNGLALAGVDDFWEGPSFPYKALGHLGRESLIILLSHNPDVNLQLKGDDRVRLVLSGHTHGGQIRLPIVNWAPWIPCSMKYRGSSGLMRETDRRWTFITKGVGTFLIPVRLNCPPDVGILRLRNI